MKSILFEVSTENILCKLNKENMRYPFLWHLEIPILSAFSIEYFSIQDGSVHTFSTKNDQILGNELIVESEYPLTDDIEGVTVVVHYHGVRDYSLLFPWVHLQKLRERLGNFYEEGEKNFEQGAWLSFALMCGAVFEGMLYAKLNPSGSKHGYKDMLESALENNLIDAEQFGIMNNVRYLRNLVHGNKFELPYIDRASAMDLRSTLNNLLKDFNKK
jgi:hypothetical protein